MGIFYLLPSSKHPGQIDLGLDLEMIRKHHLKTDFSEKANFFSFLLLLTIRFNRSCYC